MCEQLRLLAQELRKTAASYDDAKQLKCAHVLSAAKGLALLKEKVKTNVR